MKKRKQISKDEAKRIGESLHVDWEQVDLEDFRQGLMRKLKQEDFNLEMRPAYDGVLLAGKIVQSHMEEFPDYFTRLERLKAEVDEYRSRSR